MTPSYRVPGTNFSIDGLMPERCKSSALAMESVFLASTHGYGDCLTKDSHYKDKVVVKQCHFYQGNFYTFKTVCLPWNMSTDFNFVCQSEWATKQTGTCLMKSLVCFIGNWQYPYGHYIAAQNASIYYHLYSCTVNNKHIKPLWPYTYFCWIPNIHHVGT